MLPPSLHPFSYLSISTRLYHPNKSTQLAQLRQRSHSVANLSDLAALHAAGGGGAGGAGGGGAAAGDAAKNAAAAAEAAAEKKKKSFKTHFLYRGGVCVETEAGPIQFGVPPARRGRFPKQKA